MSDIIYPLTIIVDRYNGCYSRGAYTAWNCYPEQIPRGPELSDVPCAHFWDKINRTVGRGSTPNEALADLIKRIAKREARRK